MNLHISSISGIQIEYEKKLDKTSFWSQIHGCLGAGSDTIRKINIDSENEFLIGIEGFYSPVIANGGLDAIRQIAFYTNNGKYGPYETEVGTYFSSSAARGKNVGFHGKSGVFLNAIGTQAEICKVTGLTEVTLRKVYKELLESWMISYDETMGDKITANSSDVLLQQDPVEQSTSGAKRASVHDRIRMPVTYDDLFEEGKDSLVLMPSERRSYDVVE
ncbi:hypothetical protein RND71_027491 [Anisodus tanguticus]|uniref:Jacalin-type lectin domain-containing protein n=1 Tax=Anisodus tanguticus TaxID=243964 RepID=A0AAE1RHX7_9SOLA|nr:hypothetical protein RND71_027491 [Anisodus tanguticus]